MNNHCFSKQMSFRKKGKYVEMKNENIETNE